MPTLIPTATPLPIPDPQQVRWGPVDGQEAGICINSCVLFIPWSDLEVEIERRLLPQVANIPFGSRLEVRDLQGKRDWIVVIVDQSGQKIGDLWFGTNPAKDWAFDGLIRVGSAEGYIVWDTFQRFADGSYHKQ